MVDWINRLAESMMVQSINLGSLYSSLEEEDGEVEGVREVEVDITWENLGSKDVKLTSLDFKLFR